VIYWGMTRNRQEVIRISEVKLPKGTGGAKIIPQFDGEGVITGIIITNCPFCDRFSGRCGLGIIGRTNKGNYCNGASANLTYSDGGDVKNITLVPRCMTGRPKKKNHGPRRRDSEE